MTRAEAVATCRDRRGIVAFDRGLSSIVFVVRALALSRGPSVPRLAAPLFARRKEHVT
jgi:hypothetical protein